MLTPGSRVDDRYVLRELLGEGGQGAVWRVEDLLAAGQPRALKLVSIAPSRPSELERLRREARALHRLQHPGLVTTHRSFEDLDLHLFGVAMDYVDGCAISKLEGDPRFEARHRWAVLVHLSRTLAYVHEQGIVHRDLKPDNVLLTRSFWDAPERPEHVKLVDFGIAKSPGETLPDLTAADHVVGTLAYLAPEQLLPSVFGRAAPETAADIFAFGVLAYRLLVGGHPTGLPPRSTMAEYGGEYRRVLDRAEPWPHGGPEGASGQLLCDCLAVRPEGRIRDGSELSSRTERLPELCTLSLLPLTAGAGATPSTGEPDEAFAPTVEVRAGQTSPNRPRVSPSGSRGSDAERCGPPSGAFGSSVGSQLADPPTVRSVEDPAVGLSTRQIEERHSSRGRVEVSLGHSPDSPATEAGSVSVPFAAWREDRLELTERSITSSRANLSADSPPSGRGSFPWFAATVLALFGLGSGVLVWAFWEYLPGRGLENDGSPDPSAQAALPVLPRAEASRDAAVDAELDAAADAALLPADCEASSDPCPCCPTGRDCGGVCTESLAADARFDLRVLELRSGTTNAAKLHPEWTVCFGLGNSNPSSTDPTCTRAASLLDAYDMPAVPKPKLTLQAGELAARGLHVRLYGTDSPVAAAEIQQSRPAALDRAALCKGLSVTGLGGDPSVAGELTIVFALDDPAESPRQRCD